MPSYLVRENYREASLKTDEDIAAHRQGSNLTKKYRPLESWKNS